MSVSARTPASRPAEPAGEAISLPGYHDISFARNKDTGDFRAECTCGWGRIGPARDEQAIRNEAGSHDICWVRVLNETRGEP